MSDSKLRTKTGKRSSLQVATRALAIEADRAGLRVVNPPFMKGRSGAEHRFTCLIADGAAYGFDISEKVTEFQVMSTHVKEVDTGAISSIVCLRQGGRCKVSVCDGSWAKSCKVAKQLAEEYKMAMLTIDNIRSFFESQVPAKAAG